MITQSPNLFVRDIQSGLEGRLANTAAVALLGPRQVGKTSLALEIGKTRPSVYLDLESDSDLAKLAQPSLYLRDHLDKLVILDEVHRLPGLFPILRGLIDESRRQGRRSHMYLLLGSASLDLLKQSGETLAGRISYFDMGGLNLHEVGEAKGDQLWVRGGFPESFLANDEANSLLWRQDFIRTYLERDVSQFGPRISPQVLRRLWGMLAHQQGAVVNVAQLARNLEVDAKTAHNYINLLTDLLLLRRLPAWHGNIGKRLVKSPKIYLRDSGLVHALLGVANKEQLLSHPTLGASWEGFCIENILSKTPQSVQASFYRNSYGAEIDLLLTWPSGDVWAIEIKRSLAPKLEKGFYAACEDVKPTRRLLVYAGTDTYPIGEGVQVMSMVNVMTQVAASSVG